MGSCNRYRGVAERIEAVLCPRRRVTERREGALSSRRSDAEQSVAALWPRSSVAERPVALLFGYRRLAEHSALLMIVYSGVTGVTSPSPSSSCWSSPPSGWGSGLGSSPEVLPLLM